MTNEVKEILAYFEKYIKITYMHDSEPMLNWKDLKIVLDYITNLQEENKRLKEEIVKLMFDKSIILSFTAFNNFCKSSSFGLFRFASSLRSFIIFSSIIKVNIAIVTKTIISNANNLAGISISNPNSQ